MKSPVALPVVEVFHPRQAPHLAPIARDIEARSAAEVDRVLRPIEVDPARAGRAVAHLSAAARAAEALARFRRALRAKGIA